MLLLLPFINLHELSWSLLSESCHGVLGQASAMPSDLPLPWAPLSVLFSALHFNMYCLYCLYCSIVEQYDGKGEVAARLALPYTGLKPTLERKQARGDKNVA